MSQNKTKCKGQQGINEPDLENNEDQLQVKRKEKGEKRKNNLIDQIKEKTNNQEIMKMGKGKSQEKKTFVTHLDSKPRVSLVSKVS